MYLAQSAEYLTDIFSPSLFSAKVKQAVLKVIDLQKKLGFDALAFRGNSGAAFAYPLSFITGIPLICVRKGESSHGQSVEGPQSQHPIKSYLIVDDLISTGKTVRAIVEAISGAKWVNDSYVTQRAPVCAGVLLWHSACSSDGVRCEELRSIDLDVRQFTV